MLGFDGLRPLSLSAQGQHSRLAAEPSYDDVLRMAVVERRTILVVLISGCLACDATLTVLSSKEDAGSSGEGGPIDSGSSGWRR